MTSIAHGCFTWRDGRVGLEASLRSTAGIVEHVLIADGLIDGVPDLGLPWHSELSWLADRSHDWLPSSIPISSGDGRGQYPWASLSSACSWLLGRARELGADWLLFVDADQELHRGSELGLWLSDFDGEAFPLPRLDNGRRLFCPWQLIRVSAFRRYVAGCYIVETTGGEIVSLVPPGPLSERSQALYGLAPWLSHHPERRPPERYHQRLGALETTLEPPPAGVATLASLLALC